MTRERVQCKQCNEFLTRAITESGPMEEADLVLTLKMIKGAVGSLDNMGDFKCGACGGDSFRIIAASD